MYGKMFSHLNQRFKHAHEAWTKKTILEKLYTVYETIPNLLRDLTIPTATSKKYHKYLGVIYPFTVFTMTLTFLKCSFNWFF